MTQTTQPTLAVEIDITHIERNPKQPRQWFNNEELEQLTVSVREHGIIQPLVVAPSPKPDVYILIAGERRLIAARRAELEMIPVIVREVANEQEMLILALVENVDRVEMTPLEEGDAYLVLKSQGMSNAEIARKVGVTDVHVGNCINCASLPQKTRELINKDQLYISNQFISILHDIAEVSPKACDEVAQQIADTQPTLTNWFLHGMEHHGGELADPPRPWWEPEYRRRIDAMLLLACDDPAELDRAVQRAAGSRVP